MRGNLFRFSHRGRGRRGGGGWGRERGGSAFLISPIMRDLNSARSLEINSTSCLELRTRNLLSRFSQKMSSCATRFVLLISLHTARFPTFTAHVTKLFLIFHSFLRLAMTPGTSVPKFSQWKELGGQRFVRDWWKKFTSPGRSQARGGKRNPIKDGDPHRNGDLSATSQT